MPIGQLVTETKRDIIWMLAYGVVLAGALRLMVGTGRPANFEEKTHERPPAREGGGAFGETGHPPSWPHHTPPPGWR